MDQSDLRMNDLARSRCHEPHHKSLRKAEEANFKANVSFFTNLSTAEAHVIGVKFNGLHGAVGLLRFGTFLFEEKAICGLVTSGQRWSGFPVSHDEAKMEDLP